jgi:hypothetical protein
MKRNLLRKTSKKKRKKEAAKKKEAGGDEKHIYFFTWPYVDWDFLDRILGTMSFDSQCRSYIKSTYHDIRSAIISNGYISEFFHMIRGVRQECLHCCLSWWQKCLDKRFESAQKYRTGVCLEGQR